MPQILSYVVYRSQSRASLSHFTSTITSQSTRLDRKSARDDRPQEATQSLVVELDVARDRRNENDDRSSRKSGHTQAAAAPATKTIAKKPVNLPTKPGEEHARHRAARALKTKGAAAAKRKVKQVFGRSTERWYVMAAADGWKVFAFISILDAAAAAAVLVLRTPLAIRNMGLFLHTIREAFASYFSRHSLGPTRASSCARCWRRLVLLLLLTCAYTLL